MIGAAQMPVALDGAFLEALIGPPALVREILLRPPAILLEILASLPDEPRAARRREVQAEFWAADPHPAQRDREKPISLGTEPLTEAEEKFLLDIRRLPVLNDMPEDRGACEGGARPCALVRCRHTLYLNTTAIHTDPDGTKHGGAVKLTFPNREPWEMPERESCSLDVADDHDDREPKTFAEVGTLLNMTPQRVQQIEEGAFRKLRRSPLGREFAEALAKRRRRRR